VLETLPNPVVDHTYCWSGPASLLATKIICQQVSLKYCYNLLTYTGYPTLLSISSPNSDRFSKFLPAQSVENLL